MIILSIVAVILIVTGYYIQKGIWFVSDKLKEHESKR